jgi:hypothetical protein
MDHCQGGHQQAFISLLKALLSLQEVSMEIKLYNIDTLDYFGSIITSDKGWEYKDVNDHYLITTTRGMPLKALLANLVIFNLVYDYPYDSNERLP